MKSLADYLGVPDLVHPERADESIDPATLTGKDFALAVLNSPDFRRYIISGLSIGELPAAIVCRLMDYGWGKPADKLEIQTTFSTDDIPMDAIEQRIQFLQHSIRLLSKKKDEEGSIH